MPARFIEKVVVITGGGSGIGAAIAHRFHEEGAAVAILDVDPAGARRTATSLPRAHAIECDVASATSVSSAFATVAERLGPVDIVVNNAGVAAGSHAELRRLNDALDRHTSELLDGPRPPVTPMDITVNVSDDEWRKVLAVHLDGTFHVTRAALKVMVPRRSGGIINMASVCGMAGCIGAPAYSAAKAGIIGFTRSVAQEVAMQGVRVNALAPGHIDTSFNPDRSGGFRALTIARTPIGRLGTPGEVADAVLFLASEESSFFVGAVLAPNGGLVTA